MGLLREHAKFKKLLQVHRESLVGLDLSTAGEYLGVLDQTLRRHISLENRWVLPLYRRLGPAPAGGGAEQFLTEHKMILGHLIWLKRSLGRISRSRKDRKTRALEHLTRAQQFASLLTHHDLREKRVLYPRIQRRASSEARRLLLKKWQYFGDA